MEFLDWQLRFYALNSSYSVLLYNLESEKESSSQPASIIYSLPLYVLQKHSHYHSINRFHRRWACNIIIEVVWIVLSISAQKNIEYLYSEPFLFLTMSIVELSWEKNWGWNKMIKKKVIKILKNNFMPYLLYWWI